MADDPEPPPDAPKPVSQPPIVRVIDRATTDPFNVPSVFVDWCWYHDFRDGVGRMTLVSAQDTPAADGSGGTIGDPVVVARLRFSIRTATELRDKLNQIITAATPADAKAAH
jgi:hypothetical protein